MNLYTTILPSLFIFLFPYIGKRWFSTATLSSTVVSLGLLGTFGGIFIGLLEFDVTNIEAALPQLLEGLKTAFLTSIAGMCASLLLRLCPFIYGIRTEKATEHESDTEQMISILTSIEESIKQSNRESSEHLLSLNNSLNSFTQQVAEINVNAINAALQKVMEAWDSQVSSQMDGILQEINNSIKSLEQTQALNNEQTQAVNSQILTSLEILNQSLEKLGTFLDKFTSRSIGQQEAVSVQMSNLGSLVKTTEQQLTQQISNMEEKFNRELSAMEQFSKTLITIVNKLSMDHNTFEKRQKE